DPASEMIAQNDSHLCSFVVAQAEELPFDDRSFDLLFSLTSLQNFSDIDASLKEMLRVGKKKFVFSYLKTDKKDFIKKVVLRHFPSVRFYEDDKDIYCVLIL
ncbi:MAG: class I SAM-dependent methyltransferase, partial [Candidatus Woesearchaeota archaeon]